MKVMVEAEQLAALEMTLADIPRAPLIEQWGMVFVCYNTVRKMRAEATAAQESKED